MRQNLKRLTFAIMACAIVACTSPLMKQWTPQERKTMRRALSQYREMVYLEELSDAQFFIFGDQIMDEIEINHPNYSEVIDLPYLDDTIKAYITTTIIEQLDADGSNMRYIYPYRLLKSEGRLPIGLSKSQQRSFYKCLARKINGAYSNFDQFFMAVAADTTNKSQIAKFQEDCAKSLFDWSATTPTKK